MGSFMRPEFLLLIVLGFMLFGAKRLPEMGSAIGKTIKEFQRSMKEEPQVTPTTETPAIAAPAPAQPQVTAATPAATPTATLSAPTSTVPNATETPVQSSAQ